MYVISALNRNQVINHQNPPLTPPFGKWRGEKNHETSMSFLRTQEFPTRLESTGSAPTGRFFILSPAVTDIPPRCGVHVVV